MNVSVVGENRGKIVTLKEGTMRIVPIRPRICRMVISMACMHHLSMLSARYRSRTRRTYLSVFGESISTKTLIGFPLNFFIQYMPSSRCSFSHDRNFMRVINLGSSHSVNQERGKMFPYAASSSRRAEMIGASQFCLMEVTGG